MRLMLIFYRLWLSITVTNAINLSMILFSTKYNHKEPLMNSPQETMSNDVNQDGQRRLTQLEKIIQKNTVKVAIVGDKAYWVQENTFYESSVVNGSIDPETTRAVDAHKLSKKQLSNLLEILDEISN